MSLQLNQIITGNCIHILPTLPDNSFTLAFADPPYWVGFKYGDKTDAEMEYIEPHWLVEQLRRVAGKVFVTPGIGNIYDYPKPDWSIGWFKLNSMRRNGTGGFNMWEPLLYYGSSRLGIDAVSLPLSGGQPDADFHSCPKPERLLSWLIGRETEPGDSVLDPVSGSGTTCKAAYQLGRDYLGIEIDPEMAELSRQRIAKAQPPLRLPNKQNADELLQPGLWGNSG